MSSVTFCSMNTDPIGSLVTDSVYEAALISATVDFLESIETCFDCDAGMTETLDFQVIRLALLGGKVSQSDQWNIHALAKSSAALRLALAETISSGLQRRAAMEIGNTSLDG